MKQVSVVLPVYNQAGFITEALDGVYAQTYPNIELIVVDDGSTDATPGILADYQRQNGFILIRQENAGLPRALNTGLSKAQGEYLTWTSSDNIMLPGMVTALAAALDRSPDIGLVYADRYFIDEDGRTLGRCDLPDYDPYLLLHINLVHCCFLYRKECMERVGLYNPEFIYGEDWEYWIRISKHYNFRRVPQPLYHYRLHRSSMTSALMKGTARTKEFAAFDRHFRETMPVRWMIGKLKWRWLRTYRPDHPAVRMAEAWHRAALAAATD